MSSLLLIEPAGYLTRKSGINDVRIAGSQKRWRRISRNDFRCFVLVAMTTFDRHTNAQLTTDARRSISGGLAGAGL